MRKLWFQAAALRTVVLAFAFAASVGACGATSRVNNNGADRDNQQTPVVPALNAMLPQQIRSNGVVRVASTFGYPPNEFYAADNSTPVGISVDLADALGSVLGVRFEFTNVSFDSIIPGLTAHRFDTAITAMSVTPERLKFVDMLVYQHAGAVLMVAAGNPKGLSDLASACGSKVAILKGAIYEHALTAANTKYCLPAGKPPIEIDTYAEGADSYGAVAAGRADATYIDSAVANYTAKRFGGRLMVLPNIYPNSPYGASFAKDNRQLATAVQAAFAQIIRDGIYQRLLDKWGVGQEAVTSAVLQPTAG